MKKTLSLFLAFAMILITMASFASCEMSVKPAKGEKGDTGNGIAEILTEKVDGGTKITIKYTDTSKEDVVFIIPDGEKGSQGEKGDQGDQGVPGNKGDTGKDGRGILKAEIIDGCLWITYTDTPDTPVNVGHISAEDSEPERDPLLPPLADFGSEGNPYIYKALVRTGVRDAGVNEQFQWGNNGFAAIDFWATEAGSYTDAISYAVYSRNSYIEETYNCRIQQIEQNGDMTEQLKRLSIDGEKIDLTIILAKAAANAATQGLLKNLKASEMTALDLTHPSYDENSIRELAIGDHLYYLSGDMNVSTMEVVSPTVVNLMLYDDYTECFVELFDNDPTYADIYSLALDKKWTIDTMLTMSTAVNVDVNDSDGLALGSQPGDILGYFAYTGMGLYYFYSAGGRLTEINEQGNPQLSIAKHADLFDYLFSKFNAKIGDNAGWMPYGYSGARWDIFSSGRCLFTEMTLFDIRHQLRPASPFKYGILPNPTYQEGNAYSSVVNFTNCAHLWAIPNLVNNSEVAQQMMNIFAAYSNVDIKDSTMNAYYETTLYFTPSFDESPDEVMNVIKNSLVYDIALLYDWHQMGTKTLGELTISTANLYTNNVSAQDDINQNLQEIVEKLKNPQMIF